MKNEKGLTTLEVMFLIPFVLFFFICAVTSIQVFAAKIVMNRAATAAQRELSINHNQVAAKQTAVDIIQNLLPPGTWSVPGSTVPHQAFDPDSANSSDGQPDIYFLDDGSSICEAHVRYHVVTLAPGMAKLMDPSQPLLGKYINLHSVDRGHREYIPTT